MPFFDSFFVHPLKANDLGFETDSRIGTIDIPIFILHAIDDPVVPFSLGEKVNQIQLCEFYLVATETQRCGPKTLKHSDAIGLASGVRFQLPATRHNSLRTLTLLNLACGNYDFFY